MPWVQGPNTHPHKGFAEVVEWNYVNTIPRNFYYKENNSGKNKKDG